MTTFPQHIETKAAEMISKGSKMNLVAICELLLKQEARQSKPTNIKKYNQRKLVEAQLKQSDPNGFLAAKNKENAMKNLPSSLR